MPLEQSEYFETMAAQQHQHEQHHEFQQSQYSHLNQQTPTMEPMPLMPPQPPPEQPPASLYPVLQSEPEKFGVSYDPFGKAYFRPTSWAIIFDTLVGKLIDAHPWARFFDKPACKFVCMVTGLWLVHSNRPSDLSFTVGQGMAVGGFLGLASGKSPTLQGWDNVIALAKETYYRANTVDSNNEQDVQEFNTHAREVFVKLCAMSPNGQEFSDLMASDGKLVNVGAVLWAPSTMRHMQAYFSPPSPKPKPKPQPQKRTPTVPFHCAPASWSSNMSR